MLSRRSGFIQGLISGALVALAVVALVAALTRDGDDSLADQARAVIEDNYFKAVDGDELDQDSVRGMVDGLRKRYDDRFSHYFDPRAARGVQRRHERRVLGRRPDRERGPAGPAGRRRPARLARRRRPTSPPAT